jgi:hypothetical protein
MSTAPDNQDLTAEKRRLLAETRADLLKRQLSNSENYDKAVLSLSTAFLGLSLAFLKDIVPTQQAEWHSLLYASWIVLTGAVLTTIVSFWVSQRGMDVQLEKAEDYYLRDVQAALTKSGIARVTEWINAASGVLFILGVILTVAFVILNFQRSLKMGSEKKIDQVPLRESASIPRMQEVPLTKAATIPNLQKVPQAQQPQSPPAQSTPANSPAGSTQSGGDKK